MNNPTDPCKLPLKSYHHGDLRDEILRTAYEILEENNIASLSLRAVAKKVGVSHTAPYRHFENKESLLAGIATLGFNKLAAELTEAAELHPNEPAAQLQEAGYRYVKMALGSPQCTQLMHSGILPCDDTYPDLKAAGEMAFGRLKAIIEAGQDSGMFRTGDVELLALTAWSGIHGLTSLLISGNLPDILTIPVDVDLITSAVTGTMLEGLKTS